MKLNISIKTLVLLQGVLVIGSLSGEIFFGIGTEHILPLYLVLWIATWLEVSANKKYGNRYNQFKAVTVEKLSY
ncbi:hypothetical protein N9Z30_05885 [Pseudomonadales bacterium]|nr:hypothetical protein [Pseudomonadales bacterium]